MARSTSDHAESGPYRLAGSPSHLLHRAEQLAAERFAQLVRDPITLRQFAVLAAIAETPGLSQSNLVRATGVDRSTLADMLTRMEKRGWIEREASKDDGRAHAVVLAPAGRSILASSTSHARAADAAILDLMGKAKARSFLGILAKVLKKADEAAEKAEREARRKAKREARAKQKEAEKDKKKRKAESAGAAPKRNGTNKRG